MKRSKFIMIDLQLTLYNKIFGYFYNLAYPWFNEKSRWKNDIILYFDVSDKNATSYDAVLFNYEGFLHSAITGQIGNCKFTCLNRPIDELVDDFSEVAPELKSFYEKQLNECRKISNGAVMDCEWECRAVCTLTSLNHSTLRQIGNITKHCMTERLLWFTNKLTMLAYISMLIVLNIGMTLAINSPYVGLAMIVMMANMLFIINTVITFHAIISLHKKALSEIPDKLRLYEIEWPTYIKFLH